jgi:hypothetical protein
MLFLPLAEILTDDGARYLGMSMGLELRDGKLVMPTWPVFILILVTALMLLVNIFLFKNRKLQIRLCVYGIILAFGLIGLMYYFWVVIFRQIDVDSYWLKLPLILPAVSIILTYLAFRGIRRDEIMVRSLDRIR